MVSAGDPDAIVVADEPAVRSMAAHLLSDGREQPVVGLASAVDSDQLVLAPGRVRGIVGHGPRIYLVGEEALRGLGDLLGRELALPAGAARVWWPGMTARSDPRDHPLVSRLDDEAEADMLAEFARQFDLSRPLVRVEIKLIEDARGLLEHELAQAREENRNLNIERHEALARAQTAETREAPRRHDS